jgi:hypothetical protein
MPATGKTALRTGFVVDIAPSVNVLGRECAVDAFTNGLFHGMAPLLLSSLAGRFAAVTGRPPL